MMLFLLTKIRSVLKELSVIREGLERQEGQEIRDNLDAWIAVAYPKGKWGSQTPTF